MYNLLHTVRLVARPGRTYKPYIFITGAPRSGTTLLKTILRAHPDIGGGDQESTGLFRPRNLMAYYCGEISLEEMNQMVRNSSSFAALYDMVAGRLLEHYGGRRFVDKVWPGLGRLRVVPRLAPNARWLHVVRDGRDCYCSARHHPSIPQARSVDVFARYWQSCVNDADVLPAKRTLAVHYEALCEDPATTIRTIMSFLEMDMHPMQLDAEARSRGTLKRRAPHNRLARDITSATVERWRREMTERDCSQFEKIAGETLARLGYISS